MQHPLAADRHIAVDHAGLAHRLAQARQHRPALRRHHQMKHLHRRQRAGMAAPQHPQGLGLEHQALAVAPLEAAHAGQILRPRQARLAAQQLHLHPGRAQQVVQPCRQQRPLVGLDEEVGRAGLEGLLDRTLVLQPGQHQHRHQLEAGQLAQLAAGLEAVDARHHRVEHDHVGQPVGQLLQRGQTALGLDHREAALAQRADHPGQGLDDDRSQAFGDLVEQQQPRAGAQDAGDGQHLLLAAGQAGALAVRAFLQVREHRVDLVQAHAALGQRGRQHQVLFAGQAREDAALFRAVAQPQACDAVRGQADGLGAVDLDRALAAADQAHDGAQRAGAPGAVAAQQRDDLAFVHVQVHAVQHVRLAVPAVQVGDLEEALARGHHRSSARGVGARAGINALPSARSVHCPCRPR